MTLRRLKVEEFKNLYGKTDSKETDSFAISKPCMDIEYAKAFEEDGESSTKDNSLGKSIRTFVASTSAVDRQQDQINQDGWELNSFQKSGVFLWAHERALPPIAKSLAVWVENDKLMLKVQFTPPEMKHPLGDGFGDTIRQMYDGGFMKGVSVGFLPTEVELAEDREGLMPMNFISQELLEVSAAPVPVNPEALAAAKGVGIDIDHLYSWAEEIRSKGFSRDDGGLWVPDKAAEALIGTYNPEKMISVPAVSSEDTEDTEEKEGEEKAIEEEGVSPSNETPSEVYKVAFDKAVEAEGKIVNELYALCKLLGKQNRMLNKSNEDKVKKAKTLLGNVLPPEVLPATDVVRQGRAGQDNAPAKEEEKGITPEEFSSAVEKAVRAHFCTLTGRLPE